MEIRQTSIYMVENRASHLGAMCRTMSDVDINIVTPLILAAFGIGEFCLRRVSFRSCV